MDKGCGSGTALNLDTTRRSRHYVLHKTQTWQWTFVVWAKALVSTRAPAGRTLRRGEALQHWFKMPPSPNKHVISSLDVITTCITNNQTSMRVPHLGFKYSSSLLFYSPSFSWMVDANCCLSFLPWVGPMPIYIRSIWGTNHRDHIMLGRQRLHTTLKTHY